MSEKGLSRQPPDSGKVDSPDIWLKLTAKPGDTWKWKAVTYTLVGIEEVEVPAGKFKAVRVDVDDGVGNRWTGWYAAGVGVVKSVTTAGTRKGYVRVLKKFSPGGE